MTIMKLVMRRRMISTRRRGTVLAAVALLLSTNIWVASAAGEESSGGGCYDAGPHKCSCDPGSCTAELCEAQENRFWTDGCPRHCRPSDCQPQPSDAPTQTRYGGLVCVCRNRV